MEFPGQFSVQINTIDSAVWLSIFPIIVLGVGVWRERRRSRRDSLTYSIT
jgi:hypothetical protein